MPNIATGFLGGLTGLASALGGAVQGLAPLVAPIAAAAIPALLAPKTQRYPSAMPGGAMAGNGYYGGGAYPSSALALVPGGPQLSYAGMLSGPIFGGADVPSVEGGAVMRGPSRLPRTVEGKDAQGRTRVYVLAPMVKYRVSISRAGRRRCSGGR